MTRSRRHLLTTFATLVALVVLAPTAWGATKTTTTTTPRATSQVPESVPVVHSWALSPAGSQDPNTPGDRPNLSYEVAPGSTTKDAVTLANYSNVQLTFRLYATDAFNDVDGAFDVLPGDKPAKDVGTWITLPQGNITLGPRSQATIPIALTVPRTARPGDHVGALLASNAAEGTGPDGKIITLDRRTGSRLYVRVSGQLNPELSVEKIHTSYRQALSPVGGSADVSYRIVNTGNVRMRGTQRVSIGGPFGLLAKATKAKDLPELLPGQGVTLHATLRGVSATGLAFTSVKLTEKAIGTKADGDRSEGAMTFAIPLSLAALGLVLWFLALARRSAVDRQRQRVSLRSNQT